MGGGGVWGGAWGEGTKLAVRVGAPVCVGYQHNDAFPGSHPLFAGPLGYNGSKAGMELIAKADVVLCLGTRLNPFSTLPGSGIDYWPQDAKIIQVDINADRIGLTKKVAIGIEGDAKQVAEQILANGLPPDTFLNVNVPTGGCNGVQLTRQGKRKYGDAVTANIDPRGRHYYWIGGGEVGFDSIPGSDCNALHDKLISVTPLHTNLTNEASFAALGNWSLTSSVDS